MSDLRRLAAADIMTKHVVTTGPNSDLPGIAAEMQRNNIGSVVILENRRVIGILTERDFVRVVESVGMLLDKNIKRQSPLSQCNQMPQLRMSSSS
jgi:CBS domain-containing protein